MKTGIDTVKSVSIRDEYRNANCHYANFYGTYWHPDHIGNMDWAVTLYGVCDELVFETNGDPVWEFNQSEQFTAIQLEYGIDIMAAVGEVVHDH